jgi:hypothetical protein
MLRCIAIGVLVVGLCGCASQQAQTFAVPPADATPSYAGPGPNAAPPSYQQQAALAPSSQWAPATTQALPTAQPVVQTPLAPADPDKAVVRQLISTSRMAYAGSCACPYDEDKSGRCGDRSAYAQGKRNKPLCFSTDVTPEMIARQRKGDAAMAHGTN